MVTDMSPLEQSILIIFVIAVLCFMAYLWIHTLLIVVEWLEDKLEKMREK